MTVQKLIAELKKFPPDARVGFQCHDCGEDDPADTIERVYEASETVRRKYHVDVVLRP